MNVALVMALASIVVAIASGTIAYRASRATELLRQANEERSRLNVATGALQLELFLETRSFARRLVHYFNETTDHHALATVRREGNADAYHAGGLMIYRLLRPLTVGEIIEKQTLAADLLLDPKMLELLRFSHGAAEMLTGEAIGAGIEGEGSDGFAMESCWDVGHEGAATFQRIRGSYLRCGAAALLAPEAAGEPRRCISHAEFCKLWENPGKNRAAAQDFHEALEPVKAAFDGFNRQDNPIFWLRLVGYAYTSKSFYDRMWGQMLARRVWRRVKDVIGPSRHIGYEPIQLPVAAMLRSVGDGHPLNRQVSSRADTFAARFDEIVDHAL